MSENYEVVVILCMLSYLPVLLKAWQSPFCRWTAQLKLPTYLSPNVTFVLTKSIKIFAKKLPLNLSDSSIFFYWKLTLLSKQHGFLFLWQPANTTKSHRTHIGRLKSLNIYRIWIYFMLHNLHKFFWIL